MKIVIGWISYFLVLISFSLILFNKPNIPEFKELSYIEGKVYKLGCQYSRVKLLSVRESPITFNVNARWFCENNNSLSPKTLNRFIMDIDRGMISIDSMNARIWHEGVDRHNSSEVLQMYVEDELIFDYETGIKRIQTRRESVLFFLGFNLIVWTTIWLIKNRMHNKALLEKARLFFR